LIEELYGRGCNAPVGWDNPVDRAVVQPDLLMEMEEKMENIKRNLKATHDMKKSYAYKNRVFKYFKVGEHVFLKVKVKTSSLTLGSFPKFVMRYCGIFEILEKIGPIAYMLAFFSSMRVHNVFHVSLLNKYVLDPNHIIDWNVIQVEHEGDFRVELLRIMGREVKVIRNKATGLVKVQWTCYGPKDVTWEHKESMWEEYSQSFFNFEENIMQDSILSS
jgi:hypothetical protein